MNKILRRVCMILPAVLLQCLWLGLLFSWLAPWAAVLNTGLSILAFLFVLYLISKREEPAYRMLWLLVILLFPLPGALLYLVFGNKRTTRPLKKKLEAALPLPPQADDSPVLLQNIARENKRLAQTFAWVRKTTGFPLQRNGSARYYPLGDDMFPDMLDEMEKAERFIFLEYFIIENGKMWDTMVEVLARKAARGVDVRVLYDDLGSISTYTAENAQALREKGIRCQAFNPLLFVRGTLNCRDHRKMLIIDGRVCFSGGINLADEYINEIEKHGHWKDIGFRLTGPAVSNYTHMFAEFWNAFTGDPIPPECLAVQAEPAAFSDGTVLSFYDSPLRPEAVSNELYIDLLNQAQDYAWFYTPYLTPGDALMDAFARAARRGVDVRILMPGVPDKKIIYRLSRSYYPPLLEAGVRIFEYTPGFVHAKGCVVDDRVGTIGTVNLDYRSLFLHFENNSLFYRASLLTDLKADFLATQKKSVERTLQKPTFRQWLTDGVLRIFAPLC